MAERSERVRRMMENYYSDWLNGKNVLEIAQKYRVTTRTVYERLQEIADQNGVQRRDLLQYPHKKHMQRGSGNSNVDNIPPIDITELTDEVYELIEQLMIVIDDIDGILLQEEANNGKY